MKLFFLQAADKTPLTKTITVENGHVTKNPYPHIRDFNSFHHEVDDLDTFEAAIRAHADMGHCLLKGTLHRSLANESRAGATRTEDDTEWLCIDIDRARGFTDVPDFIKRALPSELHDVDHIIQYSASHGFSRGLSAHVFFLLDAPIPAPMLKSWLQRINLDEGLESQLALSVNGTTLKYPVDTTTCQNDKLLYIAPPVIVGIDPNIDIADRIVQVNQGQRRASIDIDPRSMSETEERVQATVNKVRKRAGLKPKTCRFKSMMGHRVMTNPSRAHITGPIRSERGFVYLNINGGDSYGYWHPKENPRFILNFKGEPIYLTETFLPDYWEQIQRHQEPTGRMPIVFRDFKSDSYWNGIYDPDVPSLLLARTGARDRLNDFMVQHGSQLPDPIPDWEYCFDPHDSKLLDMKKQRANRYVPTVYMRNVPPKQDHLPATIERIMHHVTADEESYTTLLHWLAWIYQRRTKPGTAIVLHGVEGTGKGLLFHNIIAPTLGPDYCRIITVQDFKDSFNEWMEYCLLLFVDEVKLDGISDRKTINQIRNMITEPTGRIRPMRTNPYQVPVYFGIIFASNDHDAIAIPESDRRHHVAARQEARLLITTKEIQQIEHELAHFMGFIMHLEIDEQRVMMATDNSAKVDMRLAAQNSVDHFFNALHACDLDYFTDLGMAEPPFNKMLEFEQSKKIIDQWIADAADSRPSKVKRDELYKVYHYIQGGKDLSPSNFSRMLKHHFVKIRVLRVDDETHRGMIIDWKTEDTTHELNAEDEYAAHN